ncbi:exo-alpha-sialidase [Noviherbaspirillum sedimenti]|uniref:Exo-alpha-sialidase n=2 Tax=Noviherbaspirillum sedimenti TaxID=2320865 RepID=A0A3A3FY78_9BURK|nr:exo-alpha-sialidase [Noviherbaspirillum sedimenti]
MPAHAHGPGGGHGAQGGQAVPELGTGAALDREGRLWAVTKDVVDGSQFLLLQNSADRGKTWSPPRRVRQEAEPVAARGEERPKIAFGPNGEIYIAYTMPVARPHVGEIRFIRSLDGGRTFSRPLTVHANRDVITHAFGSMIVDRTGRIYVAWIDGRDREKAKARQQAYSGSAIYYAVSSDAGATFQGDYKVADNTCECCRISLSLTPTGKPVAFWRHIFSPNIRDHALAELTPAGKTGAVTRATFDDWRIDACPHHGPSLAYTADGTRHQVWFNGKEGDGGGVLYTSTTATGEGGRAVALGSAQASNADVATLGKQVALVWKQFDGQSTAVVGKFSRDGGKSWVENEFARTAGDSDKPYLVADRAGIVLVWRTRNEGIRAMPIGAEQP